MTREEVFAALATVANNCDEDNALYIANDILEAFTGEKTFDAIFATAHVLGTILSRMPQEKAHLLIAVCASMAVTVHMAEQKRLAND